MGPYWWEALYQQRPAPPRGALLRDSWWKEWTPTDLPEQFDMLLASWDMSFKDRDDSSYVVGQIWGRYRAQVFLLDQVRERADFARTLAMVRALTLRWPQAMLKLVEDKANGPAVISALRYEIPGIVPVQPLGGKLSRVQAVLPLVEAGNVYLPKDAPWVEAFRQECRSFPVGQHDDQVDAMSQALQRFLPMYKERPAPPEPDFRGRSIEAIRRDAKHRWKIRA